MNKTDLVNDLIGRAANRRSFVKKLGLASAVAGAVAATEGFAQAPGIQDTDILNFALNLEYLEAEFYTIATTGQNLQQFGTTVTGSGTAGATTGGVQVSFAGADPSVQNVALEIAADERAHVALIQAALTGLGAQPIAKPAINLNALGFGFGNANEFLRLARIFEDIGVSAYGGAAPLIQNKLILGAAARILAVEAEHVGAIRLLSAQAGIVSSALDGADHVPPPAGTQYFSTNSLALTEVRTPVQVLFLAYNAAFAPGGGFFPSGVNGIINLSAMSGAVTDGATITASPNPIPFPGAGKDGITTISWNAPQSSIIQVRVNSPTGALLTDFGPKGSMATAAWVTNGTVFYLQDVSNGPASAANTLATVRVAVNSQ